MENVTFVGNIYFSSYHDEKVFTGFVKDDSGIYDYLEEPISSLMEPYMDGMGSYDYAFSSSYLHCPEAEKLVIAAFKEVA